MPFSRVVVCKAGLWDIMVPHSRFAAMASTPMVSIIAKENPGHHHDFCQVPPAGERWVQFRTVQGKTTSPLGTEVWVRAERTREDLENARGRRKDRQEKNQKLEWRVESAGCRWEICGSESCIGTWWGFWRPCMPDKNTADFTLKARWSSIFLRKPSLEKLNWNTHR